MSKEPSASAWPRHTLASSSAAKFRKNAKAPLSPEMALRVEKAFGMDMRTLLNMQAWYDANGSRRSGW
ncbi:MAG: hypothetical protein JO227_04855 [Acetobacteraceae bacterium]|nr:hypothetical protein [Acetobacteraceae bacterium]